MTRQTGVPMALALTDRDRELAAGAFGEAPTIAMRILTRIAEADGAARLIDITSAHVDSCLYHGRSGLDFAERLVALGARVTIPTTLNVGAVDLDALNTQPVYNVLSQLAYAVNSRQVSEVYVAGKPLLRGRLLTTLDEQTLRAKAREWAAKIRP